MFVMRSSCLQVRVLLVLAVGLSSAGCKQKQEGSQPPEDAIARVGDRFITAGQLQRHIDRLPPVLRQQYASAAARRPLLDAMVRQELLVQAARNRGLDSDPEYKEIVGQQLIALLMRRSLDGRDKVQAVRDEDVERYYKEHLAQFSAPEQVRISQIVVPDKLLAARLLKQVRGLRKDDVAGFAAITAKHSIDAPSRDQGGDAGYIARDSGAVSPTVRAAAFTLLTPGQVSDLVETEHGVHILKLTDRRPAAARPLAEVTGEIQQRMQAEQRSKQTEALIAAAKAKANVEIFESQVAGAAQPSLAATSGKRDGK